MQHPSSGAPDDRLFPRKRISAGGLIRNRAGELLIVKPAYRSGWLLPGGIVEADESPRHALCREIEEELGLIARPLRLLCVDYLDASADYSESLHLLFECATPDDDALAALRVDAVELLQWRLCAQAEALALLVPAIARRLRALSLGGERPVYLENGAALA